MIDGYIICFLASFVILVWCYGSSHGFFGAFIYINGGKVTNTHQRLSFDLHRFAFISPRLYEWDRVHLYSDVYIKSKKIWAFSTHGPALFCGGSPLCRLCVSVSLSFMLFIGSVHWFSFEFETVLGRAKQTVYFVLMSSCNVEHVQNALRCLSWRLLFIYSCIFPVSVFFLG